MFSSCCYSREHPKCGLLLPQQVKNGCTAISSSYCNTVYIQLSFGAKTCFQGTSKTRYNSSHTHHGATHKKFIQGRLVTCKTKFGKWKCTDCSNFVRSYCSCTPGLMFCTYSFGNHRADVAMAFPGVTHFG